MTSRVAITTSPDPSGDDPGSGASAPLALSKLAASAKADRNRAIDCYRVLAMAMVAVGHWTAIAVSTDGDGNLVAGNALQEAPRLAWISWRFQVMPLFFVVGGFSSAMSLDAHSRNDGRPQDWVAARLRRMLAPTAVLAASWLSLLGLGALAGYGALIAIGAVAAAIPLWFLANYTVDTALAPYLLPRFRRNPGLVAGTGFGLFTLLEALRFAGVPYLPHLNWILGWLLFQVAGFAWRDGLVPRGGRLLAAAGGLWALAVVAVTVGPYPVSMVHFPGIGDLSPTHPPSLALLLFGSASSATAVALAPGISRLLSGRSAGSRRSWAWVVAGNSVAMSVYLWHFTAAVAAGGLLHLLGLLPTAAVGTGPWWIQKLPLIALSLAILVGIVAVVARFEQRALLAPRRPWPGGPASMAAMAAVISVAIKVWTLGSPAAIGAGTAITLVCYHRLLGSTNRQVPAARQSTVQRAETLTS